MKQFIKNNIIGILIGGLIFSTITAYAVENKYKAEEIKYKEITVNKALNDLYNINNYGDATESDILNGKTAIVKGKKITGNLISGGYVAYFNGSKSITTESAEVPLSYFNTSYGTKSGNTITITKPGIYRIIGIVQHSPDSSAYTTNLTIKKSETTLGTAYNNWIAANNYNSTVTLSSGSMTISGIYSSDGNVATGISAVNIIVIKES